MRPIHRPTRLATDLKALLRAGLIEEVHDGSGEVGYRATAAGHAALETKRAHPHPSPQAEVKP